MSRFYVSKYLDTFRAECRGGRRNRTTHGGAVTLTTNVIWNRTFNPNKRTLENLNTESRNQEKRKLTEKLRQFR